MALNALWALPGGGSHMPCFCKSAPEGQWAQGPEGIRMEAEGTVFAHN